jgi:hypothetical protein
MYNPYHHYICSSAIYNANPTLKNKIYPPEYCIKSYSMLVKNYMVLLNLYYVAVKSHWQITVLKGLTRS